MTGSWEYAVKSRQALITVRTVCVKGSLRAAPGSPEPLAHKSLSTAFVVTDSFHICSIHSEILFVRGSIPLCFGCPNYFNLKSYGSFPILLFQMGTTAPQQWFLLYFVLTSAQ